MPATLVTFHAHPDDEAFLTAGVMARASSRGHRVVLVVATRGDAGEVGPGVLDPGESLADRRTRELTAAAELLGVHRIVWLDYADSGSDGSAPPPGAFSASPVEAAAARLAAVLDEEDAGVLTVYDAHGGYGHPDHVQVHRVGRRAAELAGTPRVYEATINRDLIETGVTIARDLGYAIPEGFAPDGDAPWYTPASALTTAVDVTEFLDRKRAAMRAHASQATSAEDADRTLALFASLPDDLFELGFGTEWFVRVGAPPGIHETDLFAATDGAP